MLFSRLFTQFEVSCFSTTILLSAPPKTPRKITIGLLAKSFLIMLPPLMTRSAKNDCEKSSISEKYIIKTYTWLYKNNYHCGTSARVNEL